MEPSSPDAGAPRRARRWWIAAGVAAVAVAGGAIVWVQARGSASASGSSAPHFADETAAAGVEHRYEGDFPFFVGGGVAAFDCDDDGLSDLYFAGGTAPAALYRNTSDVGGAIRFEPVPSPVTDLTEVTGAYPLDVDSDGTEDLMVLRNGAGNQLLRGLGDCRFEAADQQLGIDPGDAWTVGFSATWEGDATLPTLAFGNYLIGDTSDCDESALVRPDGERYGTPVPLSPGYCALSALFSDWSRTGRRDLRLANDRHYYRDGSEQLWRIEPGQPPELYTEADGWRPLQIWGMGIASQDLDGDGHPEVFITSQGDNKLQTLDDPSSGQPAYRDIALEAGVTATRPYTGGDVLPSTAWHPEFADVNNDGVFDLFVSKGNVEATVDYASKDPSNLFIGQDDGTFREGAEDAGIVSFDRARGAALVDLNLDGLLDLVVVNRVADAKIWRNVGQGDADQPEAMGHWIGMQLSQPAPNVDGIGAWIDVKVGDRTISREVTVGGGHGGGQLGWIHQGLGSASTAEVRVTWPDGEVGPWMTVDADQLVTIERGASAPTTWQGG